jgi:very-short-patch-repair endonuclease
MKILNLIKKWLKIGNTTTKQTQNSFDLPKDITEENDVINNQEQISVFEEHSVYNNRQISYPCFFNKINNKEIEFEETVRNDKGLLEDFFFDYLTNIQEYKFRNDIKIKTKEGFYTPDFSLPEYGFVIEIDEPYSVTFEGQLNPIHYIGSDDKRNTLFIKEGWQIVRFAEEQIAKYPNDCCSYICALLSQQNYEINIVLCWTYEEAKSMIINDYRNSYLPIRYKGVSGLSTFSYRSLLVRSMRLDKNEKVVLYINNQYNNDNFSIRECWVNKDDFQKIFTQTTFFKQIIKKDSWLNNQFVNNFPVFIYTFPHLFRDLDIRICGYGTQNKYFFNLAKDIDFQIVIPEDKILNWEKKWNEMLLKNTKT